MNYKQKHQKNPKSAGDNNHKQDQAKSTSLPSSWSVKLAEMDAEDQENADFSTELEEDVFSPSAAEEMDADQEQGVQQVFHAPTEFACAFVAHKPLALQVAAIDFDITFFQSHVQAAIIVEAVRRVADSVMDWHEALQQGLRSVKDDPKDVQYLTLSGEILDDMLSSAWFDMAAAKDPAIFPALKSVQSVLKEILVVGERDPLRASRMMAAISMLSCDEIVVTSPDSAAYGAEPFPIMQLPSAARDIVEATARSKCVDVSMAALPALVQLGSAIGTTRSIAVKQDWEELPILWGAVIAGSGQLKTPTLAAMTAPMKSWQLQLRNQCSGAAAESHVENCPDELGCPHYSPMVHVFTNDYTLEAVAQMLKHSPRGLAISMDELGKWLGAAGRYNLNGKQADEAKSLELFNGGIWKIDRKRDNECIMIERAAAWVIGGIQPGIFWNALGKSAEVDGKLARHLLVMPPPQTNAWSDTTTPIRVTQHWEAVNRHLYQLQFDVHGGPQKVYVSNLAQEMMRDFANRNHLQTVAAKDEKRAAMLSKMRGYVAKFALILYLTEQAESTLGAPKCNLPVRSFIERRFVDSAIVLAEWFTKEANRIYDLKFHMGGEGGDTELISFIRSKGAVSARDLMLFNRRLFPTAERAEEELDRFVDEERGRWAHVQPSGPGRPSRKFLLHNV